MAKRPKEEDLPGVEGPGVAPVKDKRLEGLADDFVEDRDAKSELAEKMTATEAKIIDRMLELNIREFKYADKVVRIKPNKTHVSVKTVTNDGVDSEEEDVA